MRLKISTYFDIGTWDKKFLLHGKSTGWMKANINDQGLDRCGDSYWFSGIHLGSGQSNINENTTNLQSPFMYVDKPMKDETKSFEDGDFIVWERELEYRVDGSEVTSVSEVSASWDSDIKTAISQVNLPETIQITKDMELVVKVKLVVRQSSKDTISGEIDFGAAKHQYVIKPCFYKMLDNYFIGSPLTQKDGRVYSGNIPADLTQEPTGSIDSNLAIYDSYTYKSRSKTFSNFFTLSSPNSFTRTATSHTIGIPSAYGVEFTPPIDKTFNRELTLNYVIKWERDNG
ncbi:hypothetical protein [Acinetobacter phage vB_AbaM_CP14]|nr:hypothetical protein [Acinetobacter phage vB_AbaM_CP14]